MSPSSTSLHGGSLESDVPVPVASSLPCGDLQPEPTQVTGDTPAAATSPSVPLADSDIDLMRFHSGRAQLQLRFRQRQQDLELQRAANNRTAHLRLPQPPASEASALSVRGLTSARSWSSSLEGDASLEETLPLNAVRSPPSHEDADAHPPPPRSSSALPRASAASEGAPDTSESAPAPDVDGFPTSAEENDDPTVPAPALPGRRKSGIAGAAAGSGQPTDADTDVHLIPISELFARLHSCEEGLSAKQADRHTATFGKNFLTPPVQPSYLWLFLSQLWSGFNAVLWFALVMSLLAWKPLGSLNGGTPQSSNVLTAIVLLLVIALSALFGFVRAVRSMRSVDAFAHLRTVETHVQRRVYDPEQQALCARWLLLDSSLLVPGDVIRLRAGDMVPADVRLLHVEGLLLNSSMLTGETNAVRATVAPTHANSMHTRNLAFCSAQVLQGTALGLVTATGDQMLIGKLQSLTSVQSDPSAGSLAQELHRFVFVVLQVVGVTAAVTLLGWAAWLRTAHPDYVTPGALVLNLLSLIIAYVPQGLPICLTLTLSLCAARMRKESALVKNLGMIDTFNAVDLLATDKTGTLTRNHLTVAEWHWGAEEESRATWQQPQQPAETQQDPEASRAADSEPLAEAHSMQVSAPPEDGESVTPDPHTILSPTQGTAPTALPVASLPLALARCACLCSEWTPVKDMAGGAAASSGSVTGDAVDAALASFLRAHLGEPAMLQLRAAMPRVHHLPFSSTLKMALSLHRVADPLPAGPPADGPPPVVASGEPVPAQEPGRSQLVVCKGAPEAILVRCPSLMDGEGRVQPMLPAHRAFILQQQSELGERGLRVLAFAEQWITGAHESASTSVSATSAAAPTTSGSSGLGAGLMRRATPMGDATLPSTGFCFLGLAAFLDPPKPDVAASIAQLHSAGIQVVMITGDHETTASAIAKQCGLVTPDMMERGVHSFVMDTPDAAPQANVPGPHTPSQSRTGRSLVDKQLTAAVGAAAAVAAAVASGAVARPFRQRIVLLEDNLPFHTHALLADGASPPTALELERESAVHPPGLVSTFDPMASALVRHSYCVVTSDTLRWFDRAMWSYVCAHRCALFVRTSPEQKLRIVQEYQARGRCVLVTGDGVNDAPALKQADIGVSMQTASEVAREAADVIILNDSFRSLVQALETGRLVSDNLKKIICVLLPGGTWAEMWPVFLGLFLGMPPALNAFQAIFICVTTDVCNALALVYEQSEADLMLRPPMDRRTEHLVNWQLIWQGYIQLGMPIACASFLAFFLSLSSQGIPPSSVLLAWTAWGDGYQIGSVVWSGDALAAALAQAQSAYFLTIIACNVGTLLCVRTRHVSLLQHNPLWGPKRNWMIPVAVAHAVLLALVTTRVKWIADLFQSAPVPAVCMLPAVVAVVCALLLDEGRKAALRTWPRSWIGKVAW